MSKIIETTVFEFDELSDKAKEKARDWYREGAFDCEWWDSVYEDAVTVANILGIEINKKPTTRMDGSPGAGETCIWFSGFASQGDGVCFEGSYEYSKGWKKKLLAYAPKDEGLLRIGQELQEAQVSLRYEGTATMAHSGHYYHSVCMDISVDYGEVDIDDSGPEYAIIQCMRDFAGWVYKQLEAESDYMNSEEAVDDSIEANEYTFLESGKRYG